MIRAALLIVMWLPSPAPEDGDVTSLLAKADGLLSSYHEDHSRIRASIELYQRVLQIDPRSSHGMLQLSRACLTYGDLIVHTDREKKEAYAEGMEWARRAIAADENTARAHFWYAANFGMRLDLEGPFTQMSKVSELRRFMQRAYDLDPADALIVDGLGTLLCELPGFLGGDIRRSEELLRKAIALDPNYALAYHDLASNLLKQKRYAEAEKVEDRALSIPEPAGMADWVTQGKPEAERQIEEIRRRVK